MLMAQLTTIKSALEIRGCCNYFNYFWYNATPFIETRLIRTKNGVTTNLKKDYMVEKSII